MWGERNDPETDKHRTSYPEDSSAGGEATPRPTKPKTPHVDVDPAIEATPRPTKPKTAPEEGLSPAAKNGPPAEKGVSRQMFKNLKFLNKGDHEVEQEMKEDHEDDYYEMGGFVRPGKKIHGYTALLRESAAFLRGGGPAEPPSDDQASFWGSDQQPSSSIEVGFVYAMEVGERAASLLRRRHVQEQEKKKRLVEQEKEKIKSMSPGELLARGIVQEPGGRKTPTPTVPPGGGSWAGPEPGGKRLPATGTTAQEQHSLVQIAASSSVEIEFSSEDDAVVMLEEDSSRQRPVGISIPGLYEQDVVTNTSRESTNEAEKLHRPTANDAEEQLMAMDNTMRRQFNNRTSGDYLTRLSRLAKKFPNHEQVSASDKNCVCEKLS